MTEDFENELRRRLAPVDAPEGFAERVMRALPADVKPAVITSLPTPRRSWMRQFGMPTALAASLLAAVMLGRYSAEQREQLAEQRGTRSQPRTHAGAAPHQRQTRYRLSSRSEPAAGGP